MDPRTEAAKRAVAIVFTANGMLFASLASRFPDVRSGLGLSNGSLGLLLLCAGLGSLCALPLAGRLIERFGATGVVRGGAVVASLAVPVVALSATVLAQPVATGAALAALGMGISVWDVAMNVEGAEVERRLGRTIMPRFHAGFSLGTVLGAGLGVPVIALGVPTLAHLLVAAALVVAAVLHQAGLFLPASADDGEGAAPRGRSAWLEPRTLAIGVMVLAFAAVEGTANDWLSLAVIDGYDAPHWLGVASFAGFLSAMTIGRLVAPRLLDRFGRAPVLWGTTAAAFLGALLVVVAPVGWLVVPAIVLWGLGGALGFPVGMSAAADEPSRAAARVSVVSTIGYAAFLLGPPLVGHLGDLVGTLESLLVVPALMVPAAFAVLAARPPRSAATGTPRPSSA